MVPANKNGSASTSALVGNRCFKIQSISKPIQVNWKSITTAKDAGKKFKE